MYYRHTASSYRLNNAPTSSLFKNSDFIWNNSNELDLVQMKKSSLLTTTYNQSSFLQILPCIRRLYTIFDSICPSIYRIHCSDSLRILNEIICLTDEYLHVTPSTKITTNELLFNDYYFDGFISKLRRPSLIRKNYYSSIRPDLYCFGQGIHRNNFNNQLNQTILFCFELTTNTIATNNLSLPIDVVILDPNEKLVSTDIKYINTYNQGYTKLFSCSYTPITKSGIYNILLYVNNNKIPYSQYTVFIYNSTSNNNSYQKEEQLLVFEDIIKKIQPEIPQYELEGDGCSTKVIVNSIARFRLRIKSLITSYYNNPMLDLFSLSILDPFGHTIIVQRRIISMDLLELTYQPMSIGEHQLIILFNNKVHRQLTIDVIHDESNYLSKLKPFGPGLKRAIVDLPTEFYVDLNQTINSDIHFRLEPSYQAEIDYEQQLATVRYVPSEEGNCPIHILENDKDILHSPFIAQVEKNIKYRDKPRISVIGLSKQIILHRPVEFQVFIDNPFDDSNNALHVDILTDDDQSPFVSIRRRHRSSYLCSFTPITLGRHLISIDYASIVAENNPFYCQSIQEKDILLIGPAINNQCLTLNQPTHFCFTLKDFLTTNFNDKNSTYESGYSSNDDISSKSSLSSSSTDIRTSTQDDDDNSNNNNNYHVKITDGHGNIKPNILVKEIFDTKNRNTVRVDFTPDEKILYINISCTCSTTFEPQLTSTPKKIDTTLILPNLCSTPRPAHIRWSLSKYTPRPVDSSTPNTKKMKKSAVPDLHRLIYPLIITNKQSMKIWVL
ncbi:unnamed protein product [Rotaria sp. Silwood1]|nr:unnamed protein product [Rotaria sp. Silwood1]CAF3386042.1 unnamed protein product [Rotaria sp. Silwood1]CAF3407995.1 unnamed protein product [Rotaria sp. Silwood1]CAF4718111.1 unnamed protein product [Rotaria sp. Silwood1]CAF4871877.1 unnamed protein product [Rotaria sp. Silwood1]